MRDAAEATTQDDAGTAGSGGHELWVSPVCVRVWPPLGRGTRRAAVSGPHNCMSGLTQGPLGSSQPPSPAWPPSF